MKHTKSLLLLLLMVLMWGLSWPIIKIGLSYTSPTNFIELRCFTGTITMFFIALVSRNLVIPRIKDLPIILTVGIFQMALMMMLANYGLSLVGAGKATFLTFTTSLWIIPLSALIHQKITKFEVLSFCVGVVGIILLIEPWKIHWDQVSTWIGELVLLLAAISWSIGILCARNMTWHRPPLQLLPWQLLLTTVITIIFAYSNGVNFTPDSISLTFISLLFYAGIISIALGYWIMILVSKHLSPAMTSLGLIFIPIISLIISSLFLGEQITFTLISSVALITLGVLIHIYSERKKNTKHNEII